MPGDVSVLLGFSCGLSPWIAGGSLLPVSSQGRLSVY